MKIKKEKDGLRVRRKPWVRGILAPVLISQLSFSPLVYSFKEEDVEKIPEGVSCARGDYQGADLRGWNLAALDFTNASFRGADLGVGRRGVGGDLRGSTLRGADLRNANLMEVQLEEADLYGADLRGSEVDEEVKRSYPLNFIPGRIDYLGTEEDRRGEDLRILSYEQLSIFREIESNKGKFMVAYLLDTYGRNDQDRREARDIYEGLMNEGMIQAAVNLGWMYENHQVLEGEGDDVLIKALNCYSQCMGSPRSRGAFHYWRLLSQLREGREKGEALYMVGIHFKNGEGVEKDTREALKWFERARDLGNPQAPYILGLLYETEDSPESLDRAFRYYLEATGFDQRKTGLYRDIWRKLGFFYAEGRGAERSLRAALTCYEKAADEGSVTGMYHAGRMCELLPLEELGEDENPVLFYERAILKDPSHAESLFRLGNLLEKGSRGVEKDLEKAQQLYRDATQYGHWVAKERFRLKQLALHPQGGSDIGRLSEVIKRSYKKERERIIGEIEIDPQINGQQVHYSLKADYEAARGIVKDIAEETFTQEEPRVNYEFIEADPFKREYNVNFDEIIEDSRLEEDKVRDFITTLRDSLKRTEAYIPENEGEIQSVLRHAFYGSTPLLVQKKLLWFYDQHMKEEEETEEEIAQGLFALKLSQNSERCLDGLTNYLDDEIVKMLSHESQEEMSLGGRISKILYEYKEKFLRQHQNPLIGAKEERTEAMILLRQRLRLPLGLVGDFIPPRYPDIGFGSELKYTPSHVMRLFLKGGEIHFERGHQHHVERVSAYTPQFLVDLLVEEYFKNFPFYGKEVGSENRKSLLSNDIITSYIEGHEELRSLYINAVETLENHPYFDLGIEGGLHIFTPVFFKRLLLEHGYLIRKKE